MEKRHPEKQPPDRAFPVVTAGALPQCRLHPGRKLSGREGVDYVFVGARLEGPDNFLALSLAGQEDHGLVGNAEEVLHQLHSVGTGDGKFQRDQAELTPVLA